jgi:hypothetical protein
MLSLSVCSGHLPLHTPTLTTGKRLEQKIMGSNTRKCVGTNLYSEMLYVHSMRFYLELKENKREIYIF